MSEGERKESREERAVRYAEQTLNVHGVYDDAEQVHADLVAALEQHTVASHKSRMLHDQIEVRELEIISELRGENPEASGAAIERMARERRAADPKMQELHADLRSTQQQQDEAQSRVTASKYRLRLLAARLNELGGLTAFYAATKGVIGGP